MRFEARGLTVGYGAPLLRDVSFEADAGQIVGILGRNGCGKTTLLRGIAGSIRRFAGSVLVDGRDLSALSVRQQAACISVLPQQTDVMAGILVRDLIAMGRYPHGRLFSQQTPQDEERIAMSAALLGISPLMDRDCAKISQGQRQLALLAKCLAQDTPVLLLDEPNAALDYDNTHMMFSALRTFAKEGGRTVLMVLHDPEIALRCCDRLLLLRDGQLLHDLTVDGASPKAAEAALHLIYPGITLRKDPIDGRFRCYYTSERIERSC